MNRSIHFLFFFAALFVLVSSAWGQVVNPVQKLFPEGTIIHNNVPYAGDTLKRHLLDIYLPASVQGDIPLVIWIHGGAWNHNSKYSDMGYMKNTVKGFLDRGYALASIDYRYSTEAAFPAQAQDCNRALEYLYTHAAEYKIWKDKFVLIGFSAGGHLASLLGLSANNAIKDFKAPGAKTSFTLAGVIDFYGPSDLLALVGSEPEPFPGDDPVTQLLGASPLQRPDLARRASPATYVDRNDPPFLIIQGEKDESVPKSQSIMLSNWLKLSNVKNELVIVKDAPHYGEMFDVSELRQKVFDFLATYLR